MKWIITYLIVSLILAYSMYTTQGAYRRGMEKSVHAGRGLGFFLVMGFIMILISPLLFLWGAVCVFKSFWLKHRYRYHLKMTDRLRERLIKEISQNEKKNK